MRRGRRHRDLLRGQGEVRCVLRALPGVQEESGALSARAHREAAAHAAEPRLSAHTWCGAHACVLTCEEHARDASLSCSLSLPVRGRSRGSYTRSGRKVRNTYGELQAAETDTVVIVTLPCLASRRASEENTDFLSTVSMTLIERSNGRTRPWLAPRQHRGVLEARQKPSLASPDVAAVGAAAAGRRARRQQCGAAAPAARVRTGLIPLCIGTPSRACRQRSHGHGRGAHHRAACGGLSAAAAGDEGTSAGSTGREVHRLPARVCLLRRDAAVRGLRAGLHAPGCG